MEWQCSDININNDMDCCLDFFVSVFFNKEEANKKWPSNKKSFHRSLNIIVLCNRPHVSSFESGISLVNI